MLNTLFAVATGRVALASLAVITIATWAVGKYNPKNAIQQRLGALYISTDNPRKTGDSLWYNTARVTRMLTRYGEADYAAHQRFILSFDLIYPICYGIGGACLLAYLCPWREGPARLLVLLPLTAMALDYGENFSMLAVLSHFRSYQQTPLALLGVSRAFTLAKHIALYLSFFALLVVACGFVCSHLQPKSRAS